MYLSIGIITTLAEGGYVFTYFPRFPFDDD